MPSTDFIVTWDGPHANRRSVAHWPTLENALAHFNRKAVAGLNPEIEGPEDIEIELAARELETQP